MTGPLQARIQAATRTGTTGDRACQWCATILPAGETRCPACGSPGIPDPTMQVPGAEEVAPATMPDHEPDPLLPDPEVWDTPEPLPRSDTGTNALNTIMVLAACGFVFALIGAAIGPYFISPVIESITGAPVEQASDVRPMGAIVGLIIGLFAGATWGWIAAADR